MTISVIFLMLTGLTYAYFRDVRKTLHGKCVLSFVLSLSFAYMTIPFTRNLDIMGVMGLYLFSTSFLLMLQWICILMFDNFWTLK